MTIKSIANPDPKRDYIQTGENKLNGFYLPFKYTALAKFLIFRLKEDRDAKIVITGSGKSTGTGKTTLAIHIARFVNGIRNYLFDNNLEWSSKEYSFMNVWEYLEKYSEAEKGDALITDELEYMADRRRHQTKENVTFSQAWSVLRYKNVVTIGTAPGLMDLEKRIPEGTDIWINIIYKGYGNVYFFGVDDFSWEYVERRLRVGNFKESIIWNPVEDEDYEYLKEQKEEIGVPGIDDQKKQDSTFDKSDLNEKEREVRKRILRNALLEIYERGLDRHFTQDQIADICEVSQSQVSTVKKELEKEGKL